LIQNQSLSTENKTVADPVSQTMEKGGLSMSAAEQHAASTTESQKAGYKPIDEEVFEMKTGSDLGKVALFVALLAVILMVMLYFSQQQNITGMGDKLHEVQGVKQELGRGSGSDFHSGRRNGSLERFACPGSQKNHHLRPSHRIREQN
jgi:hypothetical protein